MNFWPIKFLIELFDQTRKDLWLLGFLFLVMGSLELLSVFLVYKFVNGLPNYVEAGVVVQLAVGILAYFAVRPFLNRKIYNNIYLIVFSVWEQLQIGLYNGFLKRVVPFDDREDKNWSSALMTECQVVITSFLIPVILATSEIVILAALISFLFFLNPAATLVAVFCISLVFACYNVITRKNILKLGASRTRLEHRRVEVLNSVLSEFDQINIFGEKTGLEKQFKDTLSSIRVVWASHLALAQVPKSAMEFAGILGGCASVGYLYFIQGQSDEMILGFVTASALTVFRLVPGANRIILGIQHASFCKASVEAILDLMKARSADISNNEVLDGPECRVALTNYRLADGRTCDLNLCGVGLYGLSAESGVGKSVLLKCILGLRVPVYESRLVCCPGGGGRISYLPQTPALWFGTLGDNLLLDSRAAASEYEFAMNLIRKLALSDWFDRLPDGFDTVLASGAELISGGQMARLAFIRCIMNRPAIMVLDEFTANLDQQSKDLILEVCREFSMTAMVIIATHDEKTLKLTDRIIYLGRDA